MLEPELLGDVHLNVVGEGEVPQALASRLNSSVKDFTMPSFVSTSGGWISNGAAAVEARSCRRSSNWMFFGARSAESTTCLPWLVSVLNSWNTHVRCDLLLALKVLDVIEEEDVRLLVAGVWKLRKLDLLLDRVMAAGL